jgi:hypothetical protein
MTLRHKHLFLFAHGAGAPSSHPWMLRWAELLTTIGNVAAFDYPYLAEGRKRPDPLPKLIEAHRAALEKARQSHAGPVVLIGKSMGGRVGCHETGKNRGLRRLRIACLPSILVNFTGKFDRSIDQNHLRCRLSPRFFPVSCLGGGRCQTGRLRWSRR